MLEVDAPFSLEDFIDCLASRPILTAMVFFRGNRFRRMFSLFLKSFGGALMRHSATKEKYHLLLPSCHFLDGCSNFYLAL